ncbi:MAG: hypothetical protein LBK47_06610 [Prevotellaceae bacterium]|jgi:hypothetical protein|nr:hypothetical protein [Prevotellaceae bacterium]
MKKLHPQRKFGIRQVKAELQRSRKVVLPILSLAGVAFFVAFDYEYYPWLSLLSCCAIICYTIFMLLRIKHFGVTRDSQGNLIMYDKRGMEKNSPENEQKRLEQEKADIEKRLSELNQQKKQDHEQP